MPLGEGGWVARNRGEKVVNAGGEVCYQMNILSNGRNGESNKYSKMQYAEIWYTVLQLSILETLLGLGCPNGGRREVEKE